MPDKREHRIPDTSETYERGHPDKTPGLGKMDTPDHDEHADHPDSVQGSVRNDLSEQPAPKTDPDNPKPLPGLDPEHTMKNETPLGWDQAPREADTKNEHRHPRQIGKGGTPDQELPIDEAQGK